MGINKCETLVIQWLGVPVGGYGKLSSTTYNYQICANTGCYIINWYDSWEMVGLTSNGTQRYILATDANGDTLGYASNAASSGSYGISIGGACMYFRLY